ncbi:MFS transporter [Candidatus Gottesmanbacteria bacterium]|nr:MFS transporter [Candidatus Gottesmanbacteria bacterium]
MLQFLIANRAFRFLWLGQIFSQLAMNMMIFTLALVVYRATGSNTAVSGLFLAYGVPALIFGMIAGTVVDRLDRRMVLILCDFLRAVLVLFLFFFLKNMPLVYFLVCINAIINQFYIPAEAPTIPKLVPRDQLVRANSLFSFTYYSSMAIGFILAGPFLKLLGAQNTVLFLAGLFLVASLMVRNIPRQGEGFSSLLKIRGYNLWTLVGKMWQEVTNGLDYIFSVPMLSDAIVLLTGTQIIIAVLGSLAPGFADRVLEIDLRDASVVIVGPAVIGIILGALWVGSQGYRIGQIRLIKIGIVSVGVLLLLIAATVPLTQIPWWSWLYSKHIIVPVEVTLFFLLGVANSFLDVPANSTLQEKATGSMRGRVYGMLTTAVGGVGMIPVVLGGVLADTFGVAKVIFFLGVVVLCYGVWRVRYNKT